MRSTTQYGRGYASITLRLLSYGGGVRQYRFASRPGWLAFHLICLALVVTMVLLGRWQLIVSNDKHFDLQNFGYAIQWWAFSCFVAFMWARILRDRARRGEPSAEAVAAEVAAAREPGPPVAYRRYVMPSAQAQPAGTGDPTLAAYNDYLAGLAARDERR
jgi:DNA-binding transcriptional regulator of glucitol operon